MTSTRKVGRPSKFETINQEQLKKLCVAGFTDIQIADFFNINVDSLNEYKKKYPEFSASLKDWKLDADKVVEKCLYQRAIGYQFDEVTKECVEVNGKEVKGTARVKTVSKHYAPDVTAQIFWLKNRQPAQWRDKPLEVEDDSLKNQDLRFSFLPKKGELPNDMQGYLN